MLTSTTALDLVKRSMDLRYLEYIPVARNAELASKAIADEADVCVVVDKTIPSFLEGMRYDFSNFSNTFTMSSLYAESSGATLLKMKKILDILECDENDLKEVLYNIQTKELDICLVGSGGVNLNFVHWTKRILEHFSMSNLFNKVHVFDEDKIEIHNIPRIPQLITSTGSYKVNIMNKGILSKTMEINRVFLDSENITKVKEENENTVFIGAPDLETRILLEDSKFICTTHGEDRIQVSISPKVNTKLNVEAYGRIDLNNFFFGQVISTIATLGILSEDFPKEKDVTILEESFDINNVKNFKGL